MQVLASQRQVEAKFESAQEDGGACWAQASQVEPVQRTAEPDTGAGQDAWGKRAELAVRKGDDDLAREALRRKQSYQGNADQMKKQLDQQVKATQQLISNTRCAARQGP